MKVSLNWVKQFTDVDIGTDELVEKIGAQLGAVESVEHLADRYKNIYIVRVAACAKHPDADKLTVCLVDDGGKAAHVGRNDDGLVQVVCGAPNVREGMLAAWLPPGATVPASIDKEPLTLETRQIRGEISNGMLASASELAIVEHSTGIIEVDMAAQPGDDFAKTYELDDIVLDIENKMFTHRPDCFGILGVAREIAGILGKPFVSPDWYKQPVAIEPPTQDKVSLQVDNTIPELVPRFTAVALDSVEVKPSPLIMQTYLARVGKRPINNVVDATNYIMTLTGQPLHAYDADKLLAVSGNKSLKLESRLSRPGEAVTLLDGKTVTFQDDSTIIIASHDVPVGIGGVMGGASTEVDENTSRIVLECANFDMYAIRRASMKHGLFTDAVTRFNKGQSPHQNNRILREAVSTLAYVSRARTASDVQDEKGQYSAPVTVNVTSEFVERRLGLSVSANEITRLLTNVEFQVHADTRSLHITPPFWRTDIAIAEDIVEEVGRLIGFDALPLSLPRKSLEPASRNDLLDTKQYIRNILAAAGSNEVLTYSFVSENLLSKTHQSEEKALRITNALSPDLHYYRMSLTPSLLARVHPNIKADYGEFALFEIGKTHLRTVMSDTEPVPAEHERIAFVYAADSKTWQDRHVGAAYYQARVFLDQLFARLGITYTIAQPESDMVGYTDVQVQLMAPFQPDRMGLVMIDDTFVGVLGELQHSVRTSLKLPFATAAFEVDTAALHEAQSGQIYQPISKFPKIYQDVSFKLSAGIVYADVQRVVEDVLAAQEHMQSEVKPLDVYQPSQDASSKHIAFRVVAWSEEKTMTNQELTGVIAQVAQAAKTEFDAVQL